MFYLGTPQKTTLQKILLCLLKEIYQDHWPCMSSISFIKSHMSSFGGTYFASLDEVKCVLYTEYVSLCFCYGCQKMQNQVHDLTVSSFVWTLMVYPIVLHFPLPLALTFFPNLDFYIVLFYFTILWSIFPQVTSNPL